MFDNGGIICWGRGLDGLLGLSSTTVVGYTAGLETLTFIGFSDTVPALGMASSGGHACAFHANGRIRCWGANTSYQLGDKTDTKRGFGSASVSTAVYVDFAPSITFAVVGTAVGSSFSCALFSNGKVLCWGSSGYQGQLGQPSAISDISSSGSPGSVLLSEATYVSFSSPQRSLVAQIAAGELRTCGTAFLLEK